MIINPYRFGSSTPVDPNPPAITLGTLGTLRNNYGDYVGAHWYWSGNPFTVTSVGRFAVAGNTGIHNVGLIKWSTAIPFFTEAIDMTGATPGTWVWQLLATPFVFTGGVQGSEIGIMSQEVNGGDQWYDNDTLVTMTPDLAALSGYIDSAYIAGGSTGHNNDNGHMYGPVNFKYHL